MEIPLSSIFKISNPESYKVHLASWNHISQPLDVFVRDRSEWDVWNAWRGRRDDFNRERIFSLMDFYPETNQWLFGGVYKVNSRPPHNGLDRYQVELLEDGAAFIGRLKIAFKRPGRARVVRLENHYTSLQVSEILRRSYSGEAFCGYDQIDIRFHLLETIFAIQRPDWKAALENAKGVYLITDTSNGRRYVGSVSGTDGLWSRWASYIATGHGNNVALTEVIQAQGKEHARKYFKFALLEHRTPKTDDQVIFDRESYWKKVLLTRDPAYGYNEN